MKKKTLEDALFDTGAPDEIILLAMVEMYLQDKDYSDAPYYPSPFSGMLSWERSQQGVSFWNCIDQLYHNR